LGRWFGEGKTTPMDEEKIFDLSPGGELMAHGKIIYTLEFLTQIHKAAGGGEQRMTLREKPRRSISYDYIGMEPWQTHWLRMLSFARQDTLMEFPLWHAPKILEEDIYKGQKSLYIGRETLWDFRGTGSLLLWQSDEKGGGRYAFRYLAESGAVGLAKDMGRDWPMKKQRPSPSPTGY
jgi:hypothetical protein